MHTLKPPSDAIIMEAGSLVLEKKDSTLSSPISGVTPPLLLFSIYLYLMGNSSLLMMDVHCQKWWPALDRGTASSLFKFPNSGELPTIYIWKQIHQQRYFLFDKKTYTILYTKPFFSKGCRTALMRSHWLCKLETRKKKKSNEVEKIIPSDQGPTASILPWIEPPTYLYNLWHKHVIQTSQSNDLETTSATAEEFV